MKSFPLLIVSLFTAMGVTAGVAPYIGIAVGGVAANDVRYAYQGAIPSTGELKGGGGAVVEGAIGLDLDTLPFRFEAALSILANEIDAVQPDGLGGITIPLDESGLGVAAFMLNGYFDIPTGTFVEPYLFFGLGGARVHHELSEIKVDDRVAAAQVGAGLGFVVSRNVILDLKYRYFTTGDYSVSNTTETLAAEYDNNQILAGVRLRF